METRCTGICLLLFCYRWAILLVDESVLDFLSNGRGFFPALFSRNGSVVLLFLLHCFDALEYLCTVLISLLCSGLSRVRLKNNIYYLSLSFLRACCYIHFSLPTHALIN